MTSEEFQERVTNDFVVEMMRIMVDRAVANERERCAKIADSANQMVAEAIRKA